MVVKGCAGGAYAQQFGLHPRLKSIRRQSQEMHSEVVLYDDQPLHFTYAPLYG
jgi:hypothetical protein